MQKSNFHTHSVYSDGKNTIREMVEEAISRGFTALGMSDHSYAAKESIYCMSPEGEQAEFEEVRALAEEYKDRIRLYAGIELDGESHVPYRDYDYLLCSVHEIVRKGISLPIDHSEEAFVNMVNTHFHGDMVELAKAYFFNLVEHVARNKTDIIGHFDLITKYSLIPEENESYRELARQAIREIVKHCNTFELNTGAIARGLRVVPYPADFMVDEIKKCGGRILIASDCHYKERLTVWFDEGEEFLAAHGFVKNEHADLNDRVKDIEIWS